MQSDREEMREGKRGAGRVLRGYVKMRGRENAQMHPNDNPSLTTVAKTGKKGRTCQKREPKKDEEKQKKKKKKKN